MAAYSPSVVAGAAAAASATLPSSSSSSGVGVGRGSGGMGGLRKKQKPFGGFFILGVLFLFGFLFVSFRVHSTTESMCEDQTSNRLESLREAEAEEENGSMRKRTTISNGSGSRRGNSNREDENVDADNDDETDDERRDKFLVATHSSEDENERERATFDETKKRGEEEEEEEEEKEDVDEGEGEEEESTSSSSNGGSNSRVSAKKRSRRGPSGCTPNRVREFTAEALKNPKGTDTSERSSKVWLDAFGEDLAKRYNFTTCAVAGNSGSLLRPPRLNNDIDEHEVVIRLNAAPTNGRYGQRVGRKTTLRFLNAARAKTYLVGGCSKTMPCDEGSTLVATRGMPFAPSKVITNAHLSIVRGRLLDLGEGEEEVENPQRQKRKAAMEAQVLKMSEPERERLSVAQPPSNSMGAVKRIMKAYKSAYVEKCGEDDAKRLFKGPETPSTGFMAVIFALHMCSETVSVYGFKKQLKPYQYFRMRVKPSEVHDFTVEAEILKAMAKDGVLRMPGVVQDRIRKSGSSSNDSKSASSENSEGSSISGDGGSSSGSSSSSSSGSSSGNFERGHANNDSEEKESADEWFENFVSSSSE